MKHSVALKAPFPYFGGKSRVAADVWARFGDVSNFVEPFTGSAAMLLGRPLPFDGVETINDFDGFVSNFWRALKADPDTVADAADWPVNENDLHARHAWLVGQRDDMTRRLEGDPDWFDAKAAGWWAWGMSCWIGSGFCSGRGPWSVIEAEDGSRQLVHLGDNGQGVNRQLVHLGDNGQGVNRQLVHLGNNGQGVNRQLVHLGNNGRGVHRGCQPEARGGLHAYLSVLADRLANVRVCCGDFARVLGSSVTYKHGLTAVFLDPPYADEAGRRSDLYAKDSGTVAHRAREWALANGDHPQMRIAICGYEGEHAMPSGWECFAWKTPGGFGSQSDNGRGRNNAHRERIWFSPNCIDVSFDAYPLFQGFEITS